MTDQSPITVADNPAKPTLEAFIRQLITVAGVALGALGFTKAAGEASALLIVAGPIASLIAMGWGLAATYHHAKASSQMAAMLPDSQAVTR